MKAVEKVIDISGIWYFIFSHANDGSKDDSVGLFVQQWSRVNYFNKWSPLTFNLSPTICQNFQLSSLQQDNSKTEWSQSLWVQATGAETCPFLQQLPG